MADSLLRPDPSFLGTLMTRHVTDTQTDTTTIAKLPETIPDGSITTTIHTDNTVTVSFRARSGWSYQYRVDSGAWMTAGNGSFTT